MKVFGFLAAMVIACGCLSDRKTDGGGAKDCGSAYAEATDRKENELTLTNLNSPALGVEVSYEKTRPSGLEWKVKDQKVFVGDRSYTLEYSDGGSSWRLLDDKGSIAGALYPFRTDRCVSVQKLSLSLFLEQEEADAFLLYTVM